jgi:hypothetical protein
MEHQMAQSIIDKVRVVFAVRVIFFQSSRSDHLGMIGNSQIIIIFAEMS